MGEPKHSNVLAAHGGDPPRKERNRDDHDARGGKRRKRKRDPTPPPAVVDNPSAAHEEKSKKRKHKKRRSHDNAVEAPPQTGDHKSDFLSFDPSSDASLTEQNCKALSYAYQRFHAPSLWKFNKAKQNWLIRNIWSEQAIPDKYVPLVREYLMGLKGAIRQTLSETCKLKMKPSDEAAAGSQADSIQGLSSTSIDSRARSLLAALTELN